jgi:hypothetical protein
MQDEMNPPNEDVLQRSVAEALSALLLRNSEDQAPVEVLGTLRQQLSKVLAEAPMGKSGLEEIAIRAQLAAVFETEIRRQEARVRSTGGDLVVENTSTSPERRRWPRYPVHLSAQLSVGDTTLDCTVVNLSERGAQVDVAQPYPLPKFLTLKVSNGGTYRAQCRWTSGGRAGLQFTEATSIYREL